MATSAEKCVAEIRMVATQLARAEADVRRLKARQLVLARRGRRLGVTTPELAAAARMKVGTLVQRLNRAGDET